MSDEKKVFDDVNHPQHYAGQGKVECIDFIELMIKDYNAIIAGCLFVVIKYTWRSHNKNGKQDIEKALWYAEKAVSKLDDYRDCVSCPISSAKLDPSEMQIVFDGIEEVQKTLTDEEAEYFRTIIACIINGGLNDPLKDYSCNMIDALNKWVEIYK